MAIAERAPGPAVDSKASLAVAYVASTQSTTRLKRPAIRALPFRFEEVDDLRGFVERASAHLDDPLIAYYVSQALEECHLIAELFPERSEGWIPAAGASRSWAQFAAQAALVAPCRGFEGRPIDPRQVFALLEASARQGEPHARARMLLFRDVAAPKEDVIAEIPALLASRDPGVVRDVGAFLSRGEISWRYGGAPVDAAASAIAWELVACDLGYPCGAASRLVLAQCAFAGACDAYRHEEAIAREEWPERMDEARRLRADLLRALEAHDWDWLGLREGLASGP